MLVPIAILLGFVAFPARIVALALLLLVACLHFSGNNLQLLFYRLVQRFGGKNGGLFEGKCVWVTGASSGIGEELCYQLAEQGAKVVLSARREEELVRVKQRCKNPERHVVVPLDLSNVDSHQAVVAQVVKRTGGVDILVNNAGRSQRSLAEDTLLSVLEQQLTLNTTGTISLTQALLPHLISRGPAARPQIVVISSLAGKLGAPLASCYSASKHALHGYFDTLRMEIAEYGIHVCMICPGPVVSAGGENAITSTGKAAKEDNTPASAYNHRRMPTSEACDAMLCAMACRLHEAWVSPNPELVFTYIVQYSPLLAAMLSSVLGVSRVRTFRKQLKTK